MLHVTLIIEGFKMSIPVSARVQKHRKSLRASGLRPIQIWVPDTKNPNFRDECHRQSRIAAESDIADLELLRLMDGALSELDGWSS